MGHTPDTPVTSNLQGLPLESILRVMLADLDLKFTIRDGVILITTAEDLESHLGTRIYSALDLVTNSRSGAQKLPACRRGRLRPPHRLDHDHDPPAILGRRRRPGSINALDNAGAIVVSQTRNVHRQIDRLLHSLRRAKAIQGLSPIPQATVASSPRRLATPRRHPPAPAVNSRAVLAGTPAPPRGELNSP